MVGNTKRGKGHEDHGNLSTAMVFLSESGLQALRRMK
jgi:hypothetical protein